MSNHPENLDIKNSLGPPPGLRTTSNEGQAISVTQDITTFGIAGRIWDSSYALDLYLRAPTKEYTFNPPCPIPADYFLSSSSFSSSTCTTPSSDRDTENNTETAEEGQKKGLTIVEVGAGTGYVGIALAKRLSPKSKLILTDLEEVMPLMTKNAQHNIQDPTSCCRILVEPLAWGNSSHSERILEEHGTLDFIVASDLVYFPELYPPLLQTLREIATLGKTKILFGYKERSLWRETPFWEEFGRFFHIEVVRITKHKMMIQHTGENTRKEGGGDADDKACTISKDAEEDEEEEEISVFGLDEDMYVFVATKREDKDILNGVDDTLTSLMMMQIGL